MQIDLIGDIHGHADELEALLSKLGYTQKSGVYKHSQRQVVFVGDYIDRGPKIRQTLQIVKSMVEEGNAIALMGNHEYNAICFHYEHPHGGHLRKHSIDKINQHIKTIEQFKGETAEYEKYIEWFLSLPLYYETEQFRAVHACWDKKQIAYLQQNLHNARFSESQVYESVQKGTEMYQAVNITLKGKEVELPGDLIFADKEGNSRREIRIKWWEDPAEMNYKTISVEPLDYLPEHPVNPAELHDFVHYTPDEKNVFFGHYWLKGNPYLWKHNVCCLDFSVAKEGKLVAYSISENGALSPENFTHV
jgi:hypothetical protein